jgi:hypothetical protein
MYYAIEIVSSLFLSGCFGGFSGCLSDILDVDLFSGCLSDILDVDLSFLFIVREPPYRV